MSKGLRLLLCFTISFPLLLTVTAFAVTIDLDFSKLPSVQQPSGPNWTYFTLNSHTETQVFQVGLNGSSEQTLFQNTIGVGLPASDANRYELSGVLDTMLTDFTLNVRAAVLAEELPSINANHFGFSFYVIYRGRFIGVGIGTDSIGVSDALGVRTLNIGLNNTGYHDYVLSGSVGPSGSWTLKRDNVVIGTGNFNNVSGNLLLLGDGTAGGNASAEITRYTFTQSAPRAVPALTLLGLFVLVAGILGLGFLYLRYRTNFGLERGEKIL